MQIGSLVGLQYAGDDWHNRCGIVIGWSEGDPIIFWGDDYPNEREYTNQLKVLG